MTHQAYAVESDMETLLYEFGGPIFGVKVFQTPSQSLCSGMSQRWDEAYRSGEYRKYWDYSYASQEIATCAALEIFPRGGVILDVGCGSGSDAVFLATLGFRVKALDISTKALDLVRAKAKSGVSRNRSRNCDEDAD